MSGSPLQAVLIPLTTREDTTLDHAETTIQARLHQAGITHVDHSLVAEFWSDNEDHWIPCLLLLGR